MLHSDFDRFDLLQPFRRCFLRHSYDSPLPLVGRPRFSDAFSETLRLGCLIEKPPRTTTWQTHLSRSISSVLLLATAVLLLGHRGKYYRQRADSALPAPDVLRRHLATNMTGPDTLQPVCPRVSFIKYS